MTKKLKLITLIVSLIIFTSGCFSIGKSEEEAFAILQQNAGNNNKYTINAVLDAENKILSVTQQIKYVNNEDVELKEIYFHVYPNAFKQRETAPFLFDDFKSAYRRGFKPGYADIKSVELMKNGLRSELKNSLQGEGNTILKIELPESLKPGSHVALEINYDIYIPPVGERFGYGEGNYNLGNWYPIAAVYDETGWNLDKYYPVGDPFYSDVADYMVTIETPAKLTVAATGELAECKETNGRKVWKFKADNVRDFAWIANDGFEIAEGKVGDTIVKSYYYKGHEEMGKEALKYAVKSIKAFNDMYGKYPYNFYSVVETEFPSGMEYPGLVYISDRYYASEYGSDPLIITVVHETAHQWWYAVVGNDQIDEAWLDEGFAAYSETTFAETEFGKKNAENYFRNTVEENVLNAINSRKTDGVVLKPLSEFKSWDDYGPTVYDRGAMTLSELRKLVGDKTFFNIMRKYYDEFKFKIATTEDFINICEEVSNKELDQFFTKWLKEN